MSKKRISYLRSSFLFTVIFIYFLNVLKKGDEYMIFNVFINFVIMSATLTGLVFAYSSRVTVKIKKKEIKIIGEKFFLSLLQFIISFLLLSFLDSYYGAPDITDLILELSWKSLIYWALIIIFIPLNYLFYMALSNFSDAIIEMYKFLKNKV